MQILSFQRKKKLGGWGLENHFISDSAAFIYTPTAPSQAARDDYDAKAPKTPDYDAFAPNEVGFLQPQIQFPLDSFPSIES